VAKSTPQTEEKSEKSKVDDAHPTDLRKSD